MPIDKDNGALWTLGAAGALAVVGAIVSKRGSRSSGQQRPTMWLAEDSIQRWRAPDMLIEGVASDYAMWWGPTQEYDNAETVVVVDDLTVTQYDFHSGSPQGPNQWVYKRVTLTEADADSIPRAQRRDAGFDLRDPRWVVALGKYVMDYDRMDDGYVDGDDVPAP